MKIRTFRILAAAMAALLPACGGEGGEAGSQKSKKAFSVRLKSPKAGKTYTAPATIALQAVVRNSSSVAMVDFYEGVYRSRFIATSTQRPFQATWTDVPAGIYTFVARATDPQGTETFSNTVTISVLAPGETPGGWVPIASVPEGGRAIWFVDASHGWIGGEHRTISHTVDGGATWVVQSGGVPAGTMGPGPIVQIQFVDAERGWANNAGSLLRTTNGGAAWTPSSLGTGVGVSAFWFIDAEMG